MKVALSYRMRGSVLTPVVSTLNAVSGVYVLCLHSSAVSATYLREYVNCHEQTVGRIMDFIDTVGEGSVGNKAQVIENWRKEILVK